MNTTVKVLGGICLGALAGTIAGVLMAPASGKETRKQVREKAGELTDEMKSAVSDYVNQALRGYNKKVDAYAENGKHAIESIKHAIKA
ncbi:MAG: YtxH domain-containing protein [Cyclobacteriaceae bacterium]|nr:YtxH domain-containing protein [Cytophagales bacterium]MBX2901405.1 YtxH domain-containing protein [Cyclobacteriaceae bacterium]